MNGLGALHGTILAELSFDGDRIAVNEADLVVSGSFEVGHHIIAAAVEASLTRCELAGAREVTIKFIGIPAEESGGGKALLLQRGVFDDVTMSMKVPPARSDACVRWSQLTTACATTSTRQAVCQVGSAPTRTRGAAVTDDTPRERLIGTQPRRAVAAGGDS